MRTGSLAAVFIVGKRAREVPSTRGDVGMLQILVWKAKYSLLFFHSLTPHKLSGSL